MLILILIWSRVTVSKPRHQMKLWWSLRLGYWKKHTEKQGFDPSGFQDFWDIGQHFPRPKIFWRTICRPNSLTINSYIHLFIVYISVVIINTRTIKNYLLLFRASKYTSRQCFSLFTVSLLQEYVNQWKTLELYATGGSKEEKSGYDQVEDSNLKPMQNMPLNCIIHYSSESHCIKSGFNSLQFSTF